MIDIKRDEMDTITDRHEKTLFAMAALYKSATDCVGALRKEHRHLSTLGSQLTREGAARNAESEAILNALNEIEEERKSLLNKIESPSWEIRHHFHILSYEHFRGNTQPHLLEIAQVLPSRLQIAAISHQTTIKNDILLKKFNIAQVLPSRLQI